MLNKLEKFGLVSGIIGLIADFIGLVAFFSSFGVQPSQQITIEGLSFVWKAITGFVIIYGWITISWVLSRRFYVQRRNIHAEPNHIATISFKTTMALGIVIFPLTIAWIIAINQGALLEEKQLIAQIEKIQTTQTIQAILDPTLQKPTPQQTTPVRNTSHEVKKPVENLIISSSCTLVPIILFIIGLAINLFIKLLMPIIYLDIPEEDIGDLNELFY